MPGCRMSVQANGLWAVEKVRGLLWGARGEGCLLEARQRMRDVAFQSARASTHGTCWQF
jgi:hypothetical protein